MRFAITHRIGQFVLTWCAVGSIAGMFSSSCLAMGELPIPSGESAITQNDGDSRPEAIPLPSALISGVSGLVLVGGIMMWQARARKRRDR